MQNCFPMLPNPLEQSVPDEAATAAAGPSTSSSSKTLSQSITAVGELYTHLCHSKNRLTSAQQGAIWRIYEDLLLTRKEYCTWKEHLAATVKSWAASTCSLCLSVVDGPEGETLVEKSLHKEAVRAILSGAVVFFPDKNVRREKLFHMMVSSVREIDC